MFDNIIDPSIKENFPPVPLPNNDNFIESQPPLSSRHSLSPLRPFIYLSHTTADDDRMSFRSHYTLAVSIYLLGSSSTPTTIDIWIYRGPWRHEVFPSFFMTVLWTSRGLLRPLGASLCLDRLQHLDAPQWRHRHAWNETGRSNLQIGTLPFTQLHSTFIPFLTSPLLCEF